MGQIPLRKTPAKTRDPHPKPHFDQTSVSQKAKRPIKSHSIGRIALFLERRFDTILGLWLIGASSLESVLKILYLLNHRSFH